MKLYHGSSTGGIMQLNPHLSEHQVPYIYFSANIVIAAFYTVHKVARPYNWFPYGFCPDGTPVYFEYYPNALADVYQGQRGFVYKCEKTEEMSNPTHINCAYVCPTPVTVQECMVMDDVYQALLEFEKSGQLIIRRFETLSGSQKAGIENQIRQEILEHDLLSQAECDYSVFLQTRFPAAWETALTEKAKNRNETERRHV